MHDDLQSRAESFTTIGEEYHRLRPPYPAEGIDFMLPDGALDVLDLGAGTGLLTDSLVARGLSVTAVDPSTSMLDVLRERHPGVRAVQATAESTGLPDGSFDAIVVGQAWHWMDPVITSAEAARLLRPGGTLAMIWNQLVPQTPWQVEFDRIQGAPRGIDLAKDDSSDAVAPFGPRRERHLEWERDVPSENFVRLFTTHSPFLVADRDEQHRRLTQWRALVDANAGESVTEHYRTRAWRFELP